MKIAVGCDHGGFILKEPVIQALKEQGCEVLDLGCNAGERVDYPQYGQKVAEAVAEGKADRGIVICGTGLGISISANKVPGIRAALCTNEFMAMMSRRHNNSNVLALGGRVIGEELAVDIVKTWLTTEFEGGRHQRRIDQIADIEKKYNK